MTPTDQPISTRRSAVGLIVALALCFAVSALGGLATSSSVGSWYQTIQRPWWNPPGWVFGPVWLMLYTMMAVAAWDVWRSPGKTGRALVLFAVQLALNLSWSVMFFGLRSPGLGLINIALLLGFIVATALEFRKHRTRAAVLLLPYLAWTTFASFLNAAIWWLNRSA
jgi:tryptophan-rich sensory protein